MGKSTQTNYTRWKFQKRLPIVKLSIILHKGGGVALIFYPYLWEQCTCFMQIHQACGYVASKWEIR
jgi:hypothetical protein